MQLSKVEVNISLFLNLEICFKAVNKYGQDYWESLN